MMERTPIIGSQRLIRTLRLFPISGINDWKAAADTVNGYECTDFGACVGTQAFLARPRIAKYVDD
jgi:hypothetical protein